MQIGADGRFAALQNFCNLSGGIALIVKQMNGRAVLFGKVLHGLPDKGQIVPVFRDKLVVQLVRRAHGVIGKAVFAEIARHA